MNQTIITNSKKSLMTLLHLMIEQLSWNFKSYCIKKKKKSEEKGGKLDYAIPIIEVRGTLTLEDSDSN